MNGTKKEIYANRSFEEIRIAVVENSRLSDLFWERSNHSSIVGNIYKGIVENVLPGISSAFINIGFEKNAYIYISDVIGNTSGGIGNALFKGQEVMIQIIKDAISTKGMKVSMDINIPGRYLVFAPFQDHIAVSKNIEDQNERKRLYDIMERIVSEHKRYGCIIRTEASGVSEEEIRKEYKYLTRVWEGIVKKYDSSKAPSLIYKDMDITLQVARDLLSSDVSVYMLDNREDYENVVDFVSRVSPEFKDKIKFYNSPMPIFKAFNIEHEIDELRKMKVDLPSGGSIIIQEAESLCAIDVNTGRYIGLNSQEETVTQTNIEAAYEIARQLRLRNIGGIIVIDFIDMKKHSNRTRVMKALEEAVKSDRARIKILPITRLGLIEMTRERKRESTFSMLTEECPQCHGSGRVLSIDSIRLKIQRDIMNLTMGRNVTSIRIIVHPLVMEGLKSKQAMIEKSIHRSIKITSDPQLIWDDYRIIIE
ncbi:MAG: Rne/Rng family ribonuclease [Elusimicrobiales bacterium]